MMEHHFVSTVTWIGLVVDGPESIVGLQIQWASTEPGDHIRMDLAILVVMDGWVLRRFTALQNLNQQNCWSLFVVVEAHTIIITHSTATLALEVKQLITLYISVVIAVQVVIPWLTAIFQSSALTIKTMTKVLVIVPVHTVVVGGTIAVLKGSSLVNHMPPQLLTTTSSGLVLTAMQYMKQ